MKNKLLSTLVALSILTRFSQTFRRWAVLGIIRTEIGCLFAIKIARFLLGRLLPPILVNWWLPGVSHISQDGKQVLHGVRYYRQIRFGGHEREELDILTPCEMVDRDQHAKMCPTGVLHLICICATEVMHHLVYGKNILESLKDQKPLGLMGEKPAILFGHGGGWVVPGTDVQVQQLTPLVRAGYELYAYNYPLAPEDRFPVALVSTLKALDWMKRKGIKRVALLGESAGGNLVTMAAALLQNRQLLEELSLNVEENILEWDYPEITCVISWYR